MGEMDQVAEAEAPLPPIQQACTIPYRRAGSDLEVCLITSAKRQRWGFPKGIIDPGETLQEAALKESFEEAGLHGTIVGDVLGSYRDQKWGRVLHVHVVMMQVDGCDKHWQEERIRKRRWVRPKKAASLLFREEQVAFLNAAVEILEAADAPSGVTH
jgi:8-oxo-dGTP pyrophosphatase MutT (NUDIX family)